MELVSFLLLCLTLLCIPQVKECMFRRWKRLVSSRVEKEFAQVSSSVDFNFCAIPNSNYVACLNPILRRSYIGREPQSP